MHFYRLRRDKPPPPPPHLPPVLEGETQYNMPPQQGSNQQGPYRPPSNQGPPHGQFNGNFHPGMRQQMLPGHSPQMLQQQGMGYSPRSASTTQQIPMGPGSNRSAGSSSVDSYPPPLQRPGPPGAVPPHATVRMVSHPNSNHPIPPQHVLPPGMAPGMRMHHPPPGSNPGIRRPSSSTSDMYSHQQHPQMMQPQRSASTIPYPNPSPSTSQGKKWGLQNLNHKKIIHLGLSYRINHLIIKI